MLIKMEQIKPAPLIHGCDIISRKLTYCLIPTALLYRFGPQPAQRPRPLPILTVMLNCLVPIATALSSLLVELFRRTVDRNSDEYRALAESVFIMRLASVLSLFGLVVALANTVIVLSQHGSMANVIASRNNYVTEKEQAQFARNSSAFFIFIVVANVISYMALGVLTAASEYESRSFYVLALFDLGMLFLTRLSNCAELMYTCYLGSSLGKHVENFSTLYVDTMFDQFMRAIEKEDGERNNETVIRSLPFFDTTNDQNVSSDVESREQVGGYAQARYIWHSVIRALTYVYNLIRNTWTRLNMRRYPELPEMKMTKLSSTNDIQISETTRMANNHLIRVRLRRTQIMLIELRDLVSDINKTSSPLVLIYLTYETCLLILITTSSVQARVYKSIDLLILPTIAATLGLVSSVIYICTCYDETTKQLKFLINKLFDFIIMNHQVQSTGRRALRSKAQVHANDSEVCILPGSETGSINETWSQFQYTRKLANTIQFTMGGILPVTRRLVLSVLGHILSAVFISIEIMSIIDTLNMPHNGGTTNHATGAHEKHAVNETSSQYNTSDFTAHHHHRHA